MLIPHPSITLSCQRSFFRCSHMKCSEPCKESWDSMQPLSTNPQWPDLLYEHCTRIYLIYYSHNPFGAYIWSRQVLCGFKEITSWVRRMIRYPLFLTTSAMSPLGNSYSSPHYTSLSPRGRASALRDMNMT